MSQDDLTDILQRWPHEPGRINARLVEGRDGREKLQVRVNLGLLQLELDDRPDGRRPEGFATCLDRELGRLETEGIGHFNLTPELCRELREEVVQIYHRYVGLFSLGDYARVVRDTDHSLAIFDLCRDHALETDDRTLLEQFRPAAVAMRTRAEAEAALAERQPKVALEALDRGLDALLEVYDGAGMREAYERSSEVQLLRGMRDALVPKLPGSQRVELQERLRAALDEENYELAAILRDELRMMKE